MSITQRKRRILPLGLVSSLMILAGTVAAQAGGGFSKPSLALSEGAATSNAWTTIEAARAEYESQTYAEVDTGVETNPNGPPDVWANAEAGNLTDFLVEDGNAQYEQNTSAKSRVYLKGDKVMAKARAENHTVIYIDGRAFVVVDELVRAMSRSTPKGTHSQSIADTSISAASEGYLEVNTGTKTEATVRTVE